MGDPQGRFVGLFVFLEKNMWSDIRNNRGPTHSLQQVSYAAREKGSRSNMRWLCVHVRASESLFQSIYVTHNQNKREGRKSQYMLDSGSDKIETHSPLKPIQMWWHPFPYPPLLLLWCPHVVSLIWLLASLHIQLLLKIATDHLMAELLSHWPGHSKDPSSVIVTITAAR